MTIEMIPAKMPDDISDLMEMDARIFPPGDQFDADDMAGYDCFWIVLEGQRIGSTMLGKNVEFSEDWTEDKPSLGCLYIASMGILPEFQGQGIGTIVKQWQMDFARMHGLARISTNCRESNLASRKMNERFGMRVVRILPDYYEDPDEAVVVMEGAV